MPLSESTNAIGILYPDSKVHGANMGPIWGRQDPGGPHVGPMNFAICVARPYEGRAVVNMYFWETSTARRTQDVIIASL